MPHRLINTGLQHPCPTDNIPLIAAMDKFGVLVGVAQSTQAGDCLIDPRKEVPMKQAAYDLDFDKHMNATLVVACGECGHETRKRLKGLAPDHHFRCSECGHHIVIPHQHLEWAQQRTEAIKAAYHVAASA